MDHKDHKNIRLKFEIDGHRYEAVGFLNNDEPSTNGNEMITRTANENGGAAGEDDKNFLWEHREELPTKLLLYSLITNPTSHNEPNKATSLSFNRRVWEWHENPTDLDYKYSSNYLVVRRCA